MKKVIRNSVFETNSSSVHTLIICSDEEYKELLKGNMYINYDTLVTKEEYEELANKSAAYYEVSIEEVLDNPREFELPLTLDEWEDSDYLETDHCEYTTKSGDEIHIISKFGYDG